MFNKTLSYEKSGINWRFYNKLHTFVWYQFFQILTSVSDIIFILFCQIKFNNFFLNCLISLLFSDELRLSRSKHYTLEKLPMVEKTGLLLQ